MNKQLQGQNRWKSILLFLSTLMTSTGFSASLVLNNQAYNPANNQKSKAIIQWANSGKEIEESNNTLKKGTLNPDALFTLTRVGKINLDIPEKAEYFRVLVWSKDKTRPDLMTNWVDVIPDKIYTLNQDQLIPIVLMSGMGC